MISRIVTPYDDVNGILNVTLTMESTQQQLCDIDGAIEQVFCDTTAEVHLTPREKEVLQLIVSGKSNKEIARIICRVERTVEYHRNRLMRKLNTHNISDLFKKAISMGIMSS
jgi:DNA-binding NarL/FixJ family response regulator